MSFREMQLQAAGIDGRDGSSEQQEEENAEVCVTFVIRGSDPETLARIERLIKIQQANGNPLVAGQTRLAEYQAFTPSADDSALLDTLQAQRARVEVLESRIADVERAGRVRAKEALNLAEQRRVELRQQLEDQHERLVDHDRRLRELTEKYQYYAEIRDRCIKVRILQQVASGDEEALAARLKVLAERSRHFARECAEVNTLVAGAHAELDQTVGELQLPRKELEAERGAAQEQLHRLHAHIEEQEEVLDQRFRDSEAELGRRIAAKLDEANMAKRTRNDRLQKLKIQALSAASTLSDHEFRANALARTKKQLRHDFELLRTLCERFTLEQNSELRGLQEEVAAFQARLQEHRVAFGANTVERLEAFEAQVKAEQSKEWLDKINTLRDAHRRELQHAGEEFKTAVEANSKRMGKLYADTIQREVLQFEDHRAVEIQRSEELRARLAELDHRRSEVRQELARTRVETAEQRQQQRAEQAARVAQLRELKESVRAKLAAAPPAEAVAVLRRAVEAEPATPAVVAACRREVERLRCVRSMLPAVARHFDGVEYFQRLKRSGLEAAQAQHASVQQGPGNGSSPDLDHLAVSLCNAGIILEQNAKELRQQLDAYAHRFGSEFRHRGHVVREHLEHIEQLLQNTATAAVARNNGNGNNNSGDSPPAGGGDSSGRGSGGNGSGGDGESADDGLPVLVGAQALRERSPDRNPALQRAARTAAAAAPAADDADARRGDSSGGRALSPAAGAGSSPRRGIYYFNDMEDTVASLGYTKPDKMFESGAGGGGSGGSTGKGNKHMKKKPAMGLSKRGSVVYSSD